MAYRNIVKKGDDTLRKKCRVVEVFDDKLRDLLNDMTDTMYKANGVGLAGPQIGMLKRIFVMDCGEGLDHVVNPEIIATSGEQRDVEGCLSVPGTTGYVVRPQVVKLKYQDGYGVSHTKTFRGLEARCVCHEGDHLDGILFIDKMDEELR